MNNISRLTQNLLFVLLGLFMLTIIGCEKIDDIIDDPIVENELGDTLWIKDRIEGDYFMSNSLARGLDGSIYYAVGGGSVYGTPARIVALNEQTGSKLWQTDEMDHPGLSSNIIVGDDGTIYAIGFHILYAIDPNNGTFKWTWEVPQTLPLPDGGEINSYCQIGALALLNNGDLVLGSIESGVYSRALYGISKNGVKLWHNQEAVSWGISGAITIGPNNRVLYYDNYHLKSVDGASGQLQWTKKVASIWSAANNIIVDDSGNLICSFKEEGGTNFYLHKVDPANGNILWTSADISTIYGQLLSPSGYVTQLIGNLHLFDTNMGNARKFTAVNLGNVSAITSTNQYLIPAQQDWEYGCSTYNEDGTLDWHMKMDYMVGQIVIDDNKVIYGIRSDGKVFAIQGNAKLATSGWPKIGHDNRNTCNWSKN